MVVVPEVGLVDALERLLRDAKQFVDMELRNEPTQESAHALAESLVGLPSFAEAATAARTASWANGYLMTGLRPQRTSGGTEDGTQGIADSSATKSSYNPETPVPGGRPLDADALVSTGIVGMLAAGADLDLQVVAEDLAGYLAGPPIDIWDYAILDGHLAIEDPVQVIDGWELVTQTTDQLHRLLPVPATAAYQPARPFDLHDYGGGFLMLRRIDRNANPHHEPALNWEVLYSLALNRPAHPLWRPLLALSLFDNPVLQLWARYQVEPGRKIDRMFDSVIWETWTPDGVTEIEVPQFGEFGSGVDVPVLRRFLAELEPLVPDPPNDKNQKKRKGMKDKAATRLRRCAEHFLIAGEQAHGEGEVLTELNAEAVLHYVVALEGLLTNDDENHGELTRKVSQRAAVLAGSSDARRLEIAKVVRDAYGARSTYAHGSESDKEIDLPGLRKVVRGCMLARLIIGDPINGESLCTVADRALLAHEVLERLIRQPIENFKRRVDLGPQTPNATA